MVVGSFFGVRVVLNWLFLCLLVVFAVAGLLPQAIIVFSVVLFHELAHGITAHSLGLRVSEIELLPFGGVARIDDLVEVDPAVEMRVATAGPLSNAGFIVVALVAKSYEVVPVEWTDFFIRTNATLAAFNLLPALPLDGGRVFRAYLTRRKGFRKATIWAARLGKFFALLFFAAGTVGVYLGYVNMTLILLGFFVYAAAAKEEKTAMFVLIRYLTRKQEELRRNGCMASEQLVTVAKTTVGEVAKLFVPQRYHLVWVIDDNGDISGLVTEFHLIETMFEEGLEATVGHVLARQGPRQD